jgi:hypothetical protein
MGHLVLLRRSSDKYRRGLLRTATTSNELKPPILLTKRTPAHQGERYRFPAQGQS